MKMKGIRIFCPDRKTIKALLPFLFESLIPFRVVGTQAILLPSERERKEEGGYKELAAHASANNLQIYRVNQFPKECWEFGGKRPVRTRIPPDKFVPVTDFPGVSIDPQDLDLYEE